MVKVPAHIIEALIDDPDSTPVVRNVARQCLNQRAVLKQQHDKVIEPPETEVLEKQVRDLTRENKTLKRQLAELASRGHYV